MGAAAWTVVGASILACGACIAAAFDIALRLQRLIDRVESVERRMGIRR